MKRSGAEALVRQLVAVQIGRYLYQRIVSGMVESGDPLEPPEPIIDKRLGVKFINPESSADIIKFRPLNWIERSQQYEV